MATKIIGSGRAIPPVPNNAQMGTKIGSDDGCGTAYSLRASLPCPARDGLKSRSSSAVTPPVGLQPWSPRSGLELTADARASASSLPLSANRRHFGWSAGGRPLRFAMATGASGWIKTLWRTFTCGSNCWSFGVGALATAEGCRLAVLDSGWPLVLGLAKGRFSSWSLNRLRFRTERAGQPIGVGGHERQGKTGGTQSGARSDCRHFYHGGDR